MKSYRTYVFKGLYSDVAEEITGNWGKHRVLLMVERLSCTSNKLCGVRKIPLNSKIEYVPCFGFIPIAHYSIMSYLPNERHVVVVVEGKANQANL